MKDQTWFEMAEIRRRRLEGAVWIPLRASQTEGTGSYGELGHTSETYAVGTLAVPTEHRTKAEKLTWTDVGLSHDHTGRIENGKYLPCDVREDHYDGIPGLYLALAQRGNGEEPAEWHLHQDFVTTLGLKREGDAWVSIEEGYIEVARLTRRSDGSPSLMEVRASHLKDYLCARGMALYVTSYRQRLETVNDAGHISWASNPFEDTTTSDHWAGRISAVHEGGMPYGEQTAVFHAGRTDVDPEDDVPTMLGLPTEDNVKSSSWTKGHRGRRLYVVEGELWRNEWVEPGANSAIVRGDKLPATVFFTTDAAGTQETRDTLAGGGRWLWFRPEVMVALAHRRGGSLSWYTRDTGGVTCSPGYGVRFGVNALGLVNVYAKDIALLPDWQQRIWAGHNVGPDGKVSEELLASQVRAEPADTQAPEPFLAQGLQELERVFRLQLGIVAVRHHQEIPDVLRRAHRFRANERAGLLALAKDLARLTADSFDANAIQTHVKPPSGTKWGSLKSLENLLATQIDPATARKVVGPLFGIYDLRLGDAHLPASDADEALQTARVDKTSPFVFQGYQLLAACVGAIYSIVQIIEGWRKT